MVNAPKLVTRAYCGDCAAAAIAAGGTPDAHIILFGTCCENHPHIAATSCVLTAAAPAQAAKPLLELVKLTPPTLDPATHAKQALELVAAWTKFSGENAVVADRWVCAQAVETVATIHELVNQRK